MAVPGEAGVHPKGLAQLLSHTTNIDTSNDFDRGVVFVSCSVVVRNSLLTRYQLLSMATRHADAESRFQSSSWILA